MSDLAADWDEAPRRRPRPASSPVPGETSTEAKERREATRSEQREYDRWSGELCARCRMVRTHVNHEHDPAASPEGLAYYSDFLNELHRFEEAPVADRSAAEALSADLHKRLRQVAMPDPGMGGMRYMVADPQKVAAIAYEALEALDRERAAALPTLEAAGIPRCPHGAPVWACNEHEAAIAQEGSPVGLPCAFRFDTGYPCLAPEPHPVHHNAWEYGTGDGPDILRHGPEPNHDYAPLERRVAERRAALSDDVSPGVEPE